MGLDRFIFLFHDLLWGKILDEPYTLSPEHDSDAARLHAVLDAANQNIADVRVRIALNALLSRAQPVPGKPDFAAAAVICPTRPTESLTNDTIGLILETRRHLNLPFVVRQVVARCNMMVQLMHGRSNAAFVRASLTDLIVSGRVILTELTTDTLDASTYNGLFLSRGFWDAIVGRGKVLVFQTDSMLCRKAIYGLNDFLEFDFIGSRRPTGRGCGLVFNGGNGGFSLRDWQRSVRTLDRFDPDRWPAGEDDFFPLFMEADGANVARAEDSDRFCGQRWFERGCFGLHKPNFRRMRLAAAILNYEPGAWRLVTPIEKFLART